MKSWYSISAKAELAQTEISIFDEIGYWGVSAKQFIGDLKSVPANHNILLRIHSPGGEVFDGNAIANALKRHAGGVTVQIEGLAASMATVISLAGSPVKMAANGFYMIHNPWSVAMGDADDMREHAELLDKIQTGIVNAYSAKSGQSSEQIQTWMDAETWFTADEALAAGFIDEITDAHQMAASANKFPRMEKFKNAPTGTDLCNSAGEVVATAYYKPLVNLTAGEIVMDEITPEPIEETAALVVEEVVAVEAVEETPAALIEEIPAAPVAVIPNADSIIAKFNDLQARFDGVSRERDTAITALASEREALDRLERSLGVAAAKVIPAVDPESTASNTITREQFDKLDTLEKDSFFRNGGKLS